jgi:hypothetical protein
MTMSPTLEQQVWSSDTVDAALAHLVDSGELTAVQAQHVQESLVAELAAPARVSPGGSPRRQPAPWAARLIEVGAYLGAALVAAGGALVIGQHWRQLGHSGQLWLTAALVVAFAVSGGVIAALRHRRLPDAEDASWRRLASTLLTLAAAAAAGFAVVWFVPERGDMSDDRVGAMLLSMGVAAGVITLVTRFVATSALAEIALYASVLISAAGVTLLVGPPNTATPVLIGFFAIGVAWAALALLTGALSVPILAAALGLATAFVMSVGDSTTSKVLAGCLAVGGLVSYLAMPRWPLITAAILAVVVLTFELVGGAFGSAMAFLVAGVLLLVLATLGVVWRRRHTQHASG